MVDVMLSDCYGLGHETRVGAVSHGELTAERKLAVWSGGWRHLICLPRTTFVGFAGPGGKVAVTINGIPFSLRFTKP